MKFGCTGFLDWNNIVFKKGIIVHLYLSSLPTVFSIAFLWPRHKLICILIIHVKVYFVSCVLFNDDAPKVYAMIVFASNSNCVTYYILQSVRFSSFWTRQSLAIARITKVSVWRYDAQTSSPIKFVIYSNKVLIEFT